MQNRIYWGSDAPKNWKRAAPKAQSVPSAPVEYKAGTASNKGYRFTISTPTIDRSSDSIAAEGWDLKAYRRNPVVLFAHDAGAWPVGKAVSIGVEGNALVATVQFANTHEGRKAEALVNEGVLRATSVGFRPLEADYAPEKSRVGGMNFKRQELMEFSLVPVPCNPDCLISMSAATKRRADLYDIQEGQRELDAKAKAVKTKPAPKPVISELERARAKRAERQRIASMTVEEHTEYLNAKIAKKEARRIELARLRGQQ
jgi:HK97 family phage prohead protease